MRTDLFIFQRVYDLKAEFFFSKSAIELSVAFFFAILGMMFVPNKQIEDSQGRILDPQKQEEEGRMKARETSLLITNSESFLLEKDWYALYFMDQHV
jgi:hypothetical protein